MPDVLLRVLLVAVVVVVATVAGRWWQHRERRLRSPRGRFSVGQLAAVGLPVDGVDALGLLLGSPTCAPCVSVKRVLGQVASARPGFRWVDIDAADHLDLADAHHVMRVPTLFVLDADGRILARTSGVPAVHELVAVIDRESDVSVA